MGKTTIQPSNPHFFIFYVPDLHENFSIPADFFQNYLRAENCKSQAVLRTNRSSKSWTVMLKGLCFTDGWKDFERANNLRVGDLLVFKHEGRLVFDVLVFDNTLCERECTAAKAETIKKDRNIHSRNTHFTITLARSHFKWRSLVIPVKFGRDHDLLNKLGMITLKDPKGRSWPVTLRVKKQSRSTSVYATIGAGWPEFSRANKLKVGDMCTFKLLSGESMKVVLEVSVPKS